jgi:hypothetical protein
MDEQANDLAVGYGKPPQETRFQKGQSGNPGGRPRGTRSLPALLVEALSRRTGWHREDGSFMTQVEAIFATLVAEAAGPDLKAKRLLFDILVKLSRANMLWDALPKIQIEGGVDARAKVETDVARRQSIEPP